MRVGQLDALRENLRVVVIGIALVGERVGVEVPAARVFRGFETFGDSVVGRCAPVFQFLSVEKILNNQKTVFLIVRDLLL